MIYLSRLILNPRSRAVRRDLADCQDLHRTILSAFPRVEDSNGGARERFGVLYRLENEQSTGNRTMLLVQSGVAPDWSRLEAGYLLATNGPIENPAVKQVTGSYQALREGQRLRFRLRANPTRKPSSGGNTVGERRNVNRRALYKEDEQLAWLARKGEHHGFTVLAASVYSASDPRAGEGGNVIGRQAAHKSQNSGEGTKNRMTFGSALFEGLLRITDAAAFRGALESGIGSGKAYGFGLLSIARAGEA